MHAAASYRDEEAADAARGESAGNGKYDLSAEDREWVDRTAASLGPLTDKQRDTLGLLLRRHRCCPG